MFCLCCCCLVAVVPDSFATPWTPKTISSTYVPSSLNLPLSPLKSESVNHSAAAAKSLQSCPTLCDPIDVSPPGSTVHGIFQARVLEWIVIAFSGLNTEASSIKSNFSPGYVSELVQIADNRLHL